MNTASAREAAMTLKAIGGPVIIAANAPYCAFTDIVQLADGTLLAVYDAAQNHLDPAMRIELRRSGDEGRTWSEPNVLVKPINTGYGVRDPHIAMLRDGRLILCWFSYREKNQYDSIDIYTRTSDDDGRTWSDPVRIDRPVDLRHGMSMSHHPIELNDGRLLLSVRGPKEAKRGREIVGVLRSDDRGITWPTFHKIHEEPTYQGMETDLALLDDGRLVALIRRTNEKTGLWSVSEDGGKSWSEPEEAPVGHAPGILVDGSIMLVNHRTFPDGQPRENTTGEKRGNFQGKGTVISLSLDSGRSFAAHLPLGFPIRTYGADTAYGGIVKLSDNEYYTTYYSTTDDAVHVFGQRFCLERSEVSKPGSANADVKKLLDLRELPGSEQGYVVKGEGKFPRFAQYADGAVFVATHRGSHQPGRDNSLQGFVSTDGGRTWSAAREMFHQPGIDPRSPAVGVGPDDVLYAGWRERTWDDPAESRVAFYCSEDRGKGWTFVGEVTLPDADRVGHPYGKLLFANNRIFMPVYTIAKSGNGVMDSRLMVSDDGGVNWQQQGIIQTGANETFVMRGRSGDILAFYRDNQPGIRSIEEKLWLCISKDEGRTWGKSAQLTDKGQHPAEAVFLDEQTLLCFYSHRNKPFGVRARVSHDAGRTWREDIELVVEDTWTHYDCGYPTIELVDDGATLLIAWYVNRDGSGNLERDRQCRTLRLDVKQLRKAVQ